MNPTRTQAIASFLLNNTHADLASMYNFGMEVQVNVAQDKGNRVDGEYQGKQWLAWSDGLTTWKSFRIPYKANTEPEYIDKPMSYDLSAHVEGIGMTGWDWVRKCSVWFAYDFDALTGHSDRHAKKLTDSELGDIRDIVSRVPWVTLRTSTSGKGLHLYVVLATPVHTRNHHEHAALARAVLANLSGVCAYDFSNKVDICGGNMWVWHRKMLNNGERVGLKIIKSGQPLDKVPENWQEHLTVVRGKNKKVVPGFVKESETDQLFDELTGQRSKLPLDVDHKKLLDFLQEGNHTCVWYQDHWMLVTHTAALKAAHNILDFKGVFETMATGSEPGDHNCFCYPLSRGAWAIRRYSLGVKESDTWEQDGSGWTKCFLNRDMDFDLACKVARGLEHAKGGYTFESVDAMFRAVKNLGVDVTCNKAYSDRQGLINRMKEENKILISIPLEKSDKGDDMEGWYRDSKFWRRVLQIKVPPKLEGESNIIYDDIVRHLVDPSNEDAGWVIKSDSQWHAEPLTHVRAALASMNYNAGECSDIIGENIFKPWRVTNRPFEPEYPGNRTWNYKAAQLKYIPSPEPGDHPTWDRILEHCGVGLDDAIKVNTWCQQNGIIKGAEYLKCWVASLIKFPTEPLPYLFFWGDQDSGKSMFHEALNRLFTRGYTRADQALKSQAGFNGELENAVICVVEETDLKQNVQAYAKIKDWVTSLDISIHIKSKTPFMHTNTTHWIQVANPRAACPIFPGDTRITVINVPPLEVGEMIAKKELLVRLDKEAPDFLASIMLTELPFNNERLNIPVIQTEDKRDAERVNETEIETFISECCYYVPGSAVLFSDFYTRFLMFLSNTDDELMINHRFEQEWPKRKVSGEIPSKYVKGKLTTNVNSHIGNMSLNPDAKPNGVYVRDGIWIKRKNENNSVGTPSANGQGHSSQLLSNESSTEQS